jgi:hypothetical protein
MVWYHVKEESKDHANALSVRPEVVMRIRISVSIRMIVREHQQVVIVWLLLTAAFVLIVLRRQMRKLERIWIWSVSIPARRAIYAARMPRTVVVGKWLTTAVVALLIKVKIFWIRFL